jgi:hypothetical protein
MNDNKIRMNQSICQNVLLTLYREGRICADET